MSKENSQTWRLNRQINLTVLIQLVLLASLIVGSWVNLQRQLDLLQHNVTSLIESNSQFQQKFETLWSKSIECDYRLRTIEKYISKNDTTKSDY